MSKDLTIPALALATLLTGFAMPPVMAALPQNNSQAPPSGGLRTDVQPPSDAEIRDRTRKVRENMHKNDDALEQYERIEHYVDRAGGSNPKTLEDRTYRVVPDGGGTVKLLLKEGDKPADPAQYHQQLELLESLLEMMSKPNDSRGKTARDKYEKRKRERAQFVDAASEAYTIKWVGRETRNGRDCDVVEMDPNPNFHPHSMFQSALMHVTAKVWIDHQADEIVHGEAHVQSDISFGGGLLGKLYKGGVVSMDQSEIAPGIWLPTRTQYDFSGRKFLFPFEEHQTIEASHYRRIGPPEEALAAVKSELAGKNTFLVDP